MAFHTNVGIENGYAIINLHGTFDIHAVSDFLKSGDALLEAPNLAEIEINFKNVNFMDSSAMGALLKLRENATINNCEVVLCDYCGAARLTLETANFPLLFLTRPAKIAKTKKTAAPAVVKGMEEIPETV